MVKPISFSELRDITCHMGPAHIALPCHPTQVNMPSQVSWYSINLPRRDGRLSWPIYRNGLPELQLHFTSQYEPKFSHRICASIISPTSSKSDRKTDRSQLSRVNSSEPAWAQHITSVQWTEYVRQDLKNCRLGWMEGSVGRLPWRHEYIRCDVIQENETLKQLGYNRLVRAANIHHILVNFISKGVT